MKYKDIDKIAQAIAAKLAEPDGNQLLGCGSASSSQEHRCYDSSYSCSQGYECGGAGYFYCQALTFSCSDLFSCYSNYSCYRYTCSVFACDSSFECYRYST